MVMGIVYSTWVGCEVINVMVAAFYELRVYRLVEDWHDKKSVSFVHESKVWNWCYSGDAPGRDASGARYRRNHA